MKFFILFAIIFFSWRVFSQDDYYYDNRYYKIDEYIRFESDPNYQSYLNQKIEEARLKKRGINEYFSEKEKEAYIQEMSRKKHLAEMDLQVEADNSKLEAEYEKERLAEEKRQLVLEREYIAQLEKEAMAAKPTRMIASTFVSYNSDGEMDKPLKRTKREERKFILKANKAPSRK